MSTCDIDEVKALAIQKLFDLYEANPEKYKFNYNRIDVGQYVLWHECRDNVIKLVLNNMTLFKASAEPHERTIAENHHPVMKFYIKLKTEYDRKCSERRCLELLDVIKDAHLTPEEIRALEREKEKALKPPVKLWKHINLYDINKIRIYLLWSVIASAVLSVILGNMASPILAGCAFGIFLGLYIQHYYNKYVDYKNRRLENEASL